MKQTSTSWEAFDDTHAKSDGIQPNLSRVTVPRPSLGSDTIMQTAGGVKSTLYDLLIFTSPSWEK